MHVSQYQANEASSCNPRPATVRPVLQARGLRFAIDDRLLWHDLDLSLAPGERLAIAGPSGSGKTLLLRTLAALEPIQTGEIIFQDRALADWSLPEYRAHVVYLSQRPALTEGPVAALRALLTAPDVLLLDEPTASLDAGTVAAMETLIANWLQQSPERACVWTSHDRQQLERTSDRVLSLASGT